MEKENKKFRDEAIRDFNDAVRSLVAFVKKRDPRFVPNTQSEADRQKILRESAAAQAARSRAANHEKLSDFVTPDWVKARPDDDGQHSEFSMSEEESDIEQIKCVVCGKTFKSEGQAEAHEKSKKHIKAVQQLRRQMEKENIDFDLQDAPGEAEADQTTVLSRTSSEGRLPESVEPDMTGAPEDGPDLSSADSVDDDYAPRADVETRLSASTAIRRDGASEEETAERGIEELHITSPASGKKTGKAKAKREKREARQSGQVSFFTCPVISKQELMQFSKTRVPFAKRPSHRGPSCLTTYVRRDSK